ncbi:WRKY domain-containing protein [Tanacetum coccineum]
MGRSIYARILIEIEACNDFSDNLVMAVTNLEGTRYMKETIRVEYQWKPPRCSTCLIFGHSLDHCPKAPKRVVNKMDKGKGGSSGEDDEGFVEVEKKKSGGANQMATPSVGKKNASMSGNGTFFLSNSFEALNVENSGNCVIVDYDGRPQKKVDYSGDQNSEDEIESIDNEMTNYLASKPLGVGYGTKSLLVQWRETYVNDDYDPYDDDMYEGQDIHDNIQSICDNLDIKKPKMEKKTIMLVEALINGKNSASRLQNILSRNDLNIEEIQSIDDLVMDITKSFADSLSVLSSCSDPKPQEVFTANSEETPPPLAKPGRGHYKRSKSMDSRVKVTDKSEDGYQWRKYGQKATLNSIFPRCTYKEDLGCMATKHVQQLENKTNKFRITYFGRHTCPTTPHNHAAPEHDSHGVVLDFEGFKDHGYTTNIPSTTKNANIKPSRKRKPLSNKVSSTNDARLSPSLVSKDSPSMDDLYPRCKAPGSENGGSSTSIISDGPLGMGNIFENEDFLREFVANDLHDGIILESFWGYN